MEELCCCKVFSFHSYRGIREELTSSILTEVPFFYLDVARETSLLLPPTAKPTVWHFLLNVSETREARGIRLTAPDHVTVPSWQHV
jgi:hypothetical protein